jgi:hypothetical protein
MCNSGYDPGLKSKIWPRRAQSRRMCDRRADRPLCVTEIFRAKQEVCLKLLQGLRGLQRR